MPASYIKQGTVQEDITLVAKLYHRLSDFYLNSNKEVNKLPEKERKKYKSDLDLICRTKLLVSPRTMQDYTNGRSIHNDNYLMPMDKFDILKKLTDPLKGIDFSLDNKEIGFNANQELTNKLKIQFRRKKHILNIDSDNREFNMSDIKEIFKY